MATGIPAGLDTSRWSAADGRRFAFTVGAAFAVISGLLWWRGMSTASAVTGSAGVLLVLGGLVIPRRLGPVYRAWMTLAHAMSRVTTPIFMGIVYFLVLTPTGVLMRLAGRDPLVHRAGGDKSFWIPRGESGDPQMSDLERQF